MNSVVTCLVKDDACVYSAEDVTDRLEEKFFLLLLLLLLMMTKLEKVEGRGGSAGEGVKERVKKN